MRNRHSAVIHDLPLPDIAPAVTELAIGILASGKIPGKAAAGAAPIANAAVYRIDFPTHVPAPTTAILLAVLKPHRETDARLSPGFLCGSPGIEGSRADTLEILRISGDDGQIVG